MPKFAYEALDARGKMVQGFLHAENVEAAIENLRQSHFTVTTVKQTHDFLGVLARLYHAIDEAIPIKAWAIVVFMRQLATIFNSGIPLMRGLENLANQSLDRRLTDVLMRVFADVRGGMSLSKAMSLHPKAFSPVFLALVRAGEASGSLGDILNRMATLAERDHTLRSRVKAAMTYPILVFLCSVVCSWVIVSYVFPTFVNLLEGLNIELPLPTRILILFTKFATEPILFSSLVAMAVFGAIFFRSYVRTAAGRYQVDHFLLSLPVVGAILSKVALSRFCRTLGTLVASGVPVLQSIEIVSTVSGNEVIRKASEDIVTGLKAGLKLSAPMREQTVFPPMLHHMVAVGEETGSLPGILEKLAFFYDLEVEAQLSTFASLVEPLMISFMGGIVAFVVLAVFLPVYSILGSFH